MNPWVIVNPKAGSKAEPESLRQSIAARLGEGDIRITQKSGDAQRLAREAGLAYAPLLVSVGGDGTLHEVVNGLMSLKARQRPTLAIVAMGTGNDLGRSLELPRDLESGLDLALHGTAGPLDLIRVEHADGTSRYMHNAATGGFSTVVAEKLDKSDKQLWGALAYLKAAVASLGEIPDFQLHIRIDDEPLTTSACTAIVANGAYAGGGMHLVPLAKTDDGLIDLLIVNTCTVVERAEAMARFLMQTHVDDQTVIHRRGKRIEIKCEPMMKLNIDGEPIGKTPLTFTVEPAALRVMRPEAGG